MRTYETTILVDPTLPDEKVEEVIKKVESIIKNHNGSVQKIERIGKRKLAYDIKKRTQGYYLMIEFQSTGNIAAILEHEYRLMDDVIFRYLTVVVDPKVILYREKKAQMALSQEPPVVVQN